MTKFNPNDNGDGTKQVVWISDSSGIASLHVNKSTLTFEQSKIGAVEEIDGKWHVILKQDRKDINPLGYDTIHRAYRALEDFYFKNY
jgi:hypothetical protein